VRKREKGHYVAIYIPSACSNARGSRRLVKKKIGKKKGGKSQRRKAGKQLKVLGKGSAGS